MSKVIPFLEMFSALGRWTELASAVEPWQITAVVLNRAQRSADNQVAGAAGAGANLVREAEVTICRAYPRPAQGSGACPVYVRLQAPGGAEA